MPALTSTPSIASLYRALSAKANSGRGGGLDAVPVHCRARPHRPSRLRLRRRCSVERAKQLSALLQSAAAPTPPPLIPRGASPASSASLSSSCSSISSLSSLASCSAAGSSASPRSPRTSPSPRASNSSSPTLTGASPSPSPSPSPTSSPGLCSGGALPVAVAPWARSLLPTPPRRAAAFPLSGRPAQVPSHPQLRLRLPRIAETELGWPAPSSISPAEAVRSLIRRPEHGYYTTLTEEAYASGRVERLTLGRRGFGCVTWLQPLAVADLPSPAGLCLDEMVVLEHKAMLAFHQQPAARLLYPALNSPVLVVMEGVFPPSGVDRPSYAAFIASRTSAMGGRLEGYDADAGLWRFTLPCLF